MDLSPNPATDFFNVAFNTGLDISKESILSVNNLEGVVMQNIPYKINKTSIGVDVSTLKEGIYLVSLIDKNNTVYSEKLAVLK